MVEELGITDSCARRNRHNPQRDMGQALAQEIHQTELGWSQAPPFLSGRLGMARYGNGTWQWQDGESRHTHAR